MRLRRAIMFMLSDRWLSEASIGQQLAAPAMVVKTELDRLVDERRIWIMTEFTASGERIYRYCLPHDVPEIPIGKTHLGRIAQPVEMA